LADPSREIATDPHPLAAELALLNKFSSHVLAMRVKEYEGAIHDEKSKDNELDLPTIEAGASAQAFRGAIKCCSPGSDEPLSEFPRFQWNFRSSVG
jgi:hypothetical protein